MPLNVLPSITNSPGRRIAGAQVQVRQPSAPPAMAPLRGEHHEIERVAALDLEPRRTARAGRVGSGQRLHHHAFVAARERVVVEGMRAPLSRATTSRGITSAGGSTSASTSKRRAAGLAEEVLLPATQAVEEEHRQRHAFAHRLDVEHAPEAAHRLLERIRRAIGLERDGLAVEDQRGLRQRANALHDLRRGGGHVVAGARVDAHDVACRWTCTRAPSSFHSIVGIRDPRERIVEVVGRLREHRRQRLEQRRRISRERLGAAVQRIGRDRRHAAAHHRRAAHAIHRQCAAAATASTMSPSSAPCRNSPMSRRARNDASSAVAREKSSASRCARSAAEPRPDISLTACSVASTSRERERRRRTPRRRPAPRARPRSRCRCATGARGPRGTAPRSPHPRARAGAGTPPRPRPWPAAIPCPPRVRRPRRDPPAWPDAWARSREADACRARTAGARYFPCTRLATPPRTAPTTSAKPAVAAVVRITWAAPSAAVAARFAIALARSYAAMRSRHRVASSWPASP